MTFRFRYVPVSHLKVCMCVRHSNSSNAASLPPLRRPPWGEAHARSIRGAASRKEPRYRPLSAAGQSSRQSSSFSSLGETSKRRPLTVISSS
jgi:hypothetical protein